jgi:UDP-N-acetylmuramate--alanine ligase
VTDVATQLAGVSLPGRRLELVGQFAGARIYDDYAHHPAKVRASLEALKQLGPARLICAFQPHRFTRLRALMHEFAECFGDADEVLLVPVYGAGEPSAPGVDSEALAASIRVADPARPVTLLHSLEELAAELRRRLRSGDVAVLMGAGDIYRAAAMLKDEPAAVGDKQ